MLDTHDAPLFFLTEYFVCMCEALGHAVAVNWRLEFYEQAPDI